MNVLAGMYRLTSAHIYTNEVSFRSGFIELLTGTKHNSTPKAIVLCGLQMAVAY